MHVDRELRDEHFDTKINVIGQKKRFLVNFFLRPCIDEMNTSFVRFSILQISSL